jgi:hypothetical protein
LSGGAGEAGWATGGFVLNDPRIVQVTFEDEGGLTFYWSRPSDQTDTESTFHTTAISREGLESDPDLTYYASEIREDALELVMAWLKTRNH